MTTTKVHSYTLRVPCVGNDQFYHCSVLSVDELDIPKFLSDKPGCQIDDNGLIDANEVNKTLSPWDTTTFGYKRVHTSRDSRGSFQSDVYVPCDWSESHPIVMKIKGIALNESESQNLYYSRSWV